MPEDYRDYLLHPLPPGQTRQYDRGVLFTVAAWIDVTPDERARLIDLPAATVRRLNAQVRALLLAALAEQEPPHA
jgi:hypothetical protein